MRAMEQREKSKSYFPVWPIDAHTYTQTDTHGYPSETATAAAAAA